MEYRIDGEDMPSLEIKLIQGESVYTESGGMAWMMGDIEMKREGKGGMSGMFGRALSGESMFLTTYACRGTSGVIVFTPESPGKILPVELKSGESIIAQKDAFMVGEDSVILLAGTDPDDDNPIDATFEGPKGGPAKTAREGVEQPIIKDGSAAKAAPKRQPTSGSITFTFRF